MKCYNATKTSTGTGTRMATPVKRAAPIKADASHDHGRCVVAAIGRAAKAFDDKGMKLTPLRRQVFEEIASSHDAVGAYDVLDRLVRKTGERMAPVSVYRAIDALLEAGVVHRLESRNAFFACHTPHSGKRHIALVCEACGRVQEIDGTAVFAAIDQAVTPIAFVARTTVVEVVGHCHPCARVIPVKDTAFG
jgi:Fur family transcriptional regulator, zinc uptake regulator